MAKPKTTPRPVPSDDSKVVADSANNVTPITRGRKPRALGTEATDSTREVSAADPAPAVIVFGLDEGGKPHASWFSATDAALAERAAGLMRYRVLPITTDEHRVAASGLATGRVFASGRCFAPFAKMAAYEALNRFEGAFTPPPPPEPEPEPTTAVTGSAANWETIGVGNLVLASIDGDDQWWPSLVTEARGEDIFVLRWIGYPDEPPFARRRDALGLLPPAPAVAEADPAASADPVA